MKEANKVAYDKEVKAHRLTKEMLELVRGEMDELKEELAEARAQFKVFYKVKEEAEREEEEAGRAEEARRAKEAAERCRCRLGGLSEEDEAAWAALRTPEEEEAERAKEAADEVEAKAMIKRVMASLGMKGGEEVEGGMMVFRG